MALLFRLLGFYWVKESFENFLEVFDSLKNLVIKILNLLLVYKTRVLCLNYYNLSYDHKGRIIIRLFYLC